MYQELFTSDEWRTLQFSPLWVYNGVAAGDNNIDKKEIEALAKEMAEWAKWKEPLVQEVFLSVLNSIGTLMLQYRSDARDVLTGLREVSGLLDRKVTPEQAKALKSALFVVGHNVAKASGGGLFGLGDKVSDKEKAAIVVMMGALGFSA